MTRRPDGSMARSPVTHFPATSIGGIDPEDESMLNDDGARLLD